MIWLSVEHLSSWLESAPSGATIYLLGAGGCGMSALGHLLMDLGFRIAGSDLDRNELVQGLTDRGAAIQAGHREEHLAGASPILVIQSSAIPADNAEAMAAHRLGIPCARRGAALAALIGWRESICIAGMHGKTTTASLMAFALETLRQGSGYAVGSLVPQLKPHGRFRGDSDSLFVAEVDESDGTLAQTVPKHALILNVDHEHLDYFGGFGEVCREFQEFAAKARGHLVYCADDPDLERLLRQNPRSMSFGFSPAADYRVEGAAVGAEGESRRDGWQVTRFRVHHGGVLLGEFTTRLRGLKNVSNATGVIAMLHQLRFAPDAIATALDGFLGASRRQEVLHRDAEFQVVEDYGHHPAEIRATLAAMKDLRHRRVLVAFQPHRYTRTQALFEQFAGSFAGADLVWITDIYAASERPIPGVSAGAVATAIQAQGGHAEHVPGVMDLPARMLEALQPGDLVMFLGAGDIHCAAESFTASLRAMSRETQGDGFERLARRLSEGSVFRRNERLAKKTTLRVGGRADCYIEPTCEQDLGIILRFCSDWNVPLTLLGRGSNLLIRDGGIRGIVVCLCHSGFSSIELCEGSLVCGAGARLKTVAAAAKRAGLGGFEFLEGIPGTVGGALRMNAGAMGRAMFDAVRSVRFMDRQGVVHTLPREQMKAEYRSCPWFKDRIALGAVMHGIPVDEECIEEIMRDYSRKRWSSQPAAASAGCIFKNPDSIPAGKLVEELGLKGTRVGGAVVSEVHGNFIVNDGTATARDVLRLIAIIQRAASERDIELRTEVEIVGDENGGSGTLDDGVREASLTHERVPLHV